MPNIPMAVQCPKCGSFNIETKWSLTTIVSWLGKILGVPMVRIYEKRCSECGNEFQIL
jgi:predicted nucleic-acid-binding Zn-ribbon protein